MNLLHLVVGDTRLVFLEGGKFPAAVLLPPRDCFVHACLAAAACSTIFFLMLSGGFYVK
jgi:hypothetical protein